MRSAPAARLIDLRGARPSLADGLLRYKAKWGGELYDKRDGAYSWLVHWNRLDGAVADFLAHSPLVFRTGETFSGVAVADPARPWTTATVQQARDRLWVSGLERLCLVGSAQYADDVSIPAGTRLVDHEQLRNAGPRALLAALASAIGAAGMCGICGIAWSDPTRPVSAANAHAHVRLAAASRTR